MTYSRDFLQLEGKAILVTGASSGIGRDVAVQLSRHGARVILSGRRVLELESTLSSMTGDGHVVAPYDLSELDGITAFVRECARKTGGLDGLVHCAGKHATVPLRAMQSSDVTELMDANVTSAFMLVKGFRHKQVRHPHASIVLMSSAVGLVGQPGVSAYSASKGAVVLVTKSLALELAREDIRVNCVAAGVVDTEMTAGLRESIGESAFNAVAESHPLGLGVPMDVSNSILFLLSSASRWMTGSVLILDGGYTAQ